MTAFLFVFLGRRVSRKSIFGPLYFLLVMSASWIFCIDRQIDFNVHTFFYELSGLGTVRPDEAECLIQCYG